MTGAPDLSVNQSRGGSSCRHLPLKATLDCCFQRKIQSGEKSSLPNMTADNAGRPWVFQKSVKMNGSGISQINDSLIG